MRKGFFVAVLMLSSLAHSESNGQCLAVRSAYPDAKELEVSESPLFSPVVSGGNRLINSSFELGSIGYALIVNTRYESREGRTPTMTFDRADAKHGSQSLKLDLTGFHGVCVFNTHACYGMEGEKLTFSCWIKASRKLPSIHCSFGDSAMSQDGKVDWYGSSGSISADTEWRRVEFTAAKPLDWIHRGVVYKLNLPGDCIVWLDALKVEVGENATEYIPMFQCEGAIVGGDSVLVQKEGECVRGQAELRTVDYSSCTVVSEKRSFGSESYGTFKLTEKLKGHWVLPHQYAVIHPLGANRIRENKSSPGFFLGCNHTEIRHALNGDACAIVTDCGTVFSKDLVPYVRMAGNGIVRIMGSGLSWIELEPKKGCFNWSRLDGAVEPALAAGLEVLLCPGGSAYMAWVDPQKDGKRRNWYVRKGSREGRKHAFYNAEKNTGAKSRVPAEADWVEHLTGIIRHYGERITMFELINEPNLQLGDPSDYYEVLAAGAKTIRRYSPKNRIVGVCATGDFGGEIAPYVEGVGKLGGLDLIDVMSFHPYDAPTDIIGPGAETQLKSVLALRDKFRPGLPVLQNECYFLCDQWKNRGFSWRVANWPAGNVIRRLAIDLAYGLCGSMPMSVTDYQTGDPCHPYFAEAGGFNFGFTASNRFVAQNFFAYLLEGAHDGRKIDLPNGLNGVSAVSADGRTVAVIWAKRPEDVQELVVPAGAAAYDMYGNCIKSESVRVTDEPLYFVGNKVKQRSKKE